MKKMFGLAAVLVCALAGATFAADNDFASKSYNLAVGTTSVGGVYNTVATAWSQSIERHLPNVRWDVQTTGGSVGNMQLYGNGELDLPMALGITMVDAMKGGTRSFPNALEFNSITVVNQGYFHIVARTGSGIEKLEDLKDRKVSTGEPGHSTESVFALLCDGLGWNMDTDIKRQRLNLQDSVDALSDGRIDAMIYMGGCPVAAIQEACVTSKTGYMISVDPELLKKVTDKYSYVVAAEAAPGIFNNEKPVNSLGCNNFLVCSPKMDEELVYQMVKTILNNVDEWHGCHSSVKNLVPQNACLGSPVPFHPGAVRYFKEVGVWPAK